jgi:hypothetical protein
MCPAMHCKAVAAHGPHRFFSRRRQCVPAHASAHSSDGSGQVVVESPSITCHGARAIASGWVESSGMQRRVSHVSLRRPTAIPDVSLQDIRHRAPARPAGRRKANRL